MKKIPLTQGKFTIVDDGDFEYLKNFKWSFAKGYAVRNNKIKGNFRHLFMHRIILKPSPKMFTDHINHNKLDNRRCNLRECTMSQNLMNQKVSSVSTSGYKGVHFLKDRQKWQVEIMVFYKKIYLGQFDNKLDAALAYNKAALKYFGEFACLNELKLI